MSKIIFIIFLYVVSFLAEADTTRSIDADFIKSSNHANTWSLPSTSGTLTLASITTQETPSGTINGSNVTFVLSYTPTSSTSLDLYIDGLKLIEGSGNDFTLSGSTITMLTAPKLGQSLYATYSR